MKTNKRILLPLILLFLAALSSRTALAANTNSLTPSNTTKNALTLTVGEYTETISANVLETWLAHTNTFSISTKFKAEFANPAYCPVNKIFCDLTLTQNKRERFQLSAGTLINEKNIRAYLTELAKKVDREPEDAKFVVTDGKVSTFAEAKNGIKLNQDQSLDLLVATLNKADLTTNPTVSLPFDSKKSTTDYADVNNLGITSLIGSGTSNFKGSPVNRIKNIKRALQQFNGVIIKSGEEFSFVKNLGDVDQEHGYFPELVIKNNSTELDFGGGVCQVSTTVFRAAIYSGLKITARRNHAYPVGYYSPQGMDSTVFVPSPDLRFINNTPGNILIQAKIMGTVLTFDFYGTNDERQIKIDGPYVTEKQPDGAMKTSFTQHVIDKNGKEFITDTFKSDYDSPYRYPHPGGPVLSAKPSNWSEEEWRNYKKAAKAAAQAAKNMP